MRITVTQGQRADLVDAVRDLLLLLESNGGVDAIALASSLMTVSGALADLQQVIERATHGAPHIPPARAGRDL